MGSTIIPVRTDGDVGHVRREARRIAREAGLTSQAVEEAAIAATELATNLLRHRTIDGEMVLSRLAGGKGSGLEILARDRGPGIADLRLAVSDHWSSNGTSGCGLGAVRRLMDEFDIRSNPVGAGSGDTEDEGASEVGTLVTTRKWAVTDSQPERFVYSANSRPYPGEKANGDSFFIDQDQGSLLVAVADGLGHGPEAAHASQVAMAHVRANRRKDLEGLMGELHGVLRGTRGAAVTLVRVSGTEGRLTHIAVGNVETRVYPVGRSQLVSRPGVVGMGALPRLSMNEIAWPQDGTLVVYSDGLGGKWDLREIPPEWSASATAAGHYLMRSFARSNDDATVVVAREAR